MRSGLFTIASALSLLLCITTVVLWFRGAGRSEGWYLKPSPTVILSPPRENLSSNWSAQWRIYWGSNASITFTRQFTPVPRKAIVGYFAYTKPQRQWNPLPQSERVTDPRIAAEARVVGSKIISIAYRTKPATAWSHLGITYISHEQEFGKFPVFNGYFTTEGAWSLRVPLLYLFILFAALPCLWAIRLYRTKNVPKGHCPSCHYNLAGNTSGVCPECGMTTAWKFTR